MLKSLSNEHTSPNKAFIVEAVRCAGGKRNGKLSGWHPTDLGAAVIDGLLQKIGDPDRIAHLVDDVIFGCVTQHGSQAENLGRNVVLSSRILPDSVPAFTLDRQCGSAQQALHVAAQAVMSGTQDIVIAGGVECMSVVPMDSNVHSNWSGGPHMGDELTRKYRGKMIAAYQPYDTEPTKFDQFVAAELTAKKFAVTRQKSDAFAARSHKLLAAAQKAGRFKDEIIPLYVRKQGQKQSRSQMHDSDEGVRPNTGEDTLAKLPPILKSGTQTAGTASQICDGASAMLVCNQRGLEKLKPAVARARVVGLSVVGVDPLEMLTGPIPATFNVLERCGLGIDDIDLFEVNEAFASVPLAWSEACTGGDLSRVNVNGGAIAHGHPMGATGGILVAKLINELQRRKKRYGLVTMCESGGTANAVVIESVLPEDSIVCKKKNINTTTTTTTVHHQQQQGDSENTSHSPQHVVSMARGLDMVSAWRRNATAITVVGPDGVEISDISFLELQTVVVRFANVLSTEFGVKRDKRVLLALPSGIELVAALFAVWNLGAIPINIGGSLIPREFDRIVSLALPHVIIRLGGDSTRGHSKHTKPLIRKYVFSVISCSSCYNEECCELDHPATVSIPVQSAFGTLNKHTETKYNLSAEEGTINDEPQPLRKFTDTISSVWLAVTSGGSTGLPKIIMLNSPSVVTMTQQADGGFAMEDGFSTLGGGRVSGVDLITAPMSHNAPLHCVVHGILAGSHQVLMSKFEAEGALRALQDFKCNYMYVVPTVMKRIWDLEHTLRLKYDIRGLKAVFHMAAPCPPWLKSAWCEWLGPEKVYELYGGSEALAWTLIRGDVWCKAKKYPGLNLVGAADFGEFRIQDDCGNALPPNTMGEVWMRAGAVAPLPYWYIGAESNRNPQGWETLGDMGMMDELGNLHLGDRKRDMVLVGGINVYPAEVEAAMEEHPMIQSAIIVGVPDSDKGQVLHAVFHALNDESDNLVHLSDDNIKEFLSSRLQHVKIPSKFTSWSVPLRGDDGKCRRSEVASIIANQSLKPSTNNRLLHPSKL